MKIHKKKKDMYPGAKPSFHLGYCMAWAQGAVHIGARTCAHLGDVTREVHIACPRAPRMGEVRHISAQAGNTMVARAALLMLPVWAMRCWTVVEPPASIILCQHLAFHFLASLKDCGSTMWFKYPATEFIAACWWIPLLPSFVKLNNHSSTTRIPPMSHSR